MPLNEQEVLRVRLLVAEAMQGVLKAAAADNISPPKPDVHGFMLSRCVCVCGGGALIAVCAL
jgi:hypothetical protein